MTPIERLRATKEELPPELRNEILALGAAAVTPLIEMLLDEELGSGDALAEGWPPIHAAELLVDLRATEAIEPMLDLICELDPDVAIYSSIEERLPELGAAVVEPALLRLEKADQVGAQGLTGVLARLGVRDARIFDAIRETFDDDVVIGAMQFVDYGDREALPLLEEAIDEFDPDYSTPLWRMDLTELLDAHQLLGGVLAEDVERRVDAMDATWRAMVAARGAGRTSKVGRNDPCPCGSGKKYKKCCLGKAAEGARAEADPPRGTAKQLLDFAQPLLEASDGSVEGTRAAMAFARSVWEIAVSSDEADRGAMIDQLLSDVPADARPMADMSVRKLLEMHRLMFPEISGPGRS